ncbi:MAG: hydroxyacid dehydrogenase [Bacteroidetes bacterium]|nr:hydroxyacid dehydrogenase [Bacteroidota bacterium]
MIADGHECIAADKFSLEEIYSQLHDSNGIVIRSRVNIDKDFIDRSTALKFIARCGAGMESIDVEYASQKGIACLNSPEGNRNAVGEHALGMLLMLFNNLNRADRQVRAGEWIREKNRGHELEGKTVGIIGFGNMGSAFAEKLKGFNCRKLAFDKYRSGFANDFVQEATFEEIKRQANVLSLHIPLTSETEFLINEKFINSFAKPFYLINTARGKCVSTHDLVNGIKSGKVLGACLDVYEYEDASFEKFSIEAAGLKDNADWIYLTQSEKVILTPHIAGWTFESLRKIAEVLVKKIRNL